MPKDGSSAQQRPQLIVGVSAADVNMADGLRGASASGCRFARSLLSCCCGAARQSDIPAADRTPPWFHWGSSANLEMRSRASSEPRSLARSYHVRARATLGVIFSRSRHSSSTRGS